MFKKKIQLLFPIASFYQKIQETMKIQDLGVSWNFLNLYGFLDFLMKTPEYSRISMKIQADS